MPAKTRLYVSIAAVLGISLAALEITVVGTAAPLIVRDLGGFESYSWIFSLYLLTSTIAMPFWGRAADHWGRKPLFLAAMIVFLIGSLLCGFSTSFTQLVFFRSIQGLGGGGLVPLAFTIIADIYDRNARTKIQGYLSAVWGIAALLGPFIGGIMSETIGWRWIFFINIIPGTLAIIFLLSFFHETGRLAAKFRLSLQSLISSIVFVIVLLSALHFLQLKNYQIAFTLMAATCLTFFLFIYTEKYAPYPLFAKQLLKHPVFIMTCVTGFLSSAIIVGLAAFIPLLFQAVHRYTPTLSGLIIFPFTISWVFVSIFSTRLMIRIHYKTLLLIGFLLLSLGMGLFEIYFFKLNALITIVSMTIMGAGMAFNYPILLITTQYDVPKTLVGFATSSIFWIRNLGSTIGITIMGITLSWQFTNKLLNLTPTPQTQNLVTQLNTNPDSLLNPQILNQIQASPEIHQALNSVLFWVFLIMLIAAILNMITIPAFPKHVNHDHADSHPGVKTPG